MTARRAVAVTGVGLVTSLGGGVEENWRRGLEGASGARGVERFPVEGLPVRIACCVAGDAAEPERERSLRIGLESAREAVAAAGLVGDGLERTGLVLALPPAMPGLDDWARYARDAGSARPFAFERALADLEPGGDARLFQRSTNAWLAASIADSFGIATLPSVVTTACASGATAVRLAAAAIRRGTVERALVIGSDANVRPDVLLRFALLATLSTANEHPERASRPFDAARDGFVLGEGAGALVLESAESAERRGAPIAGWVLGSGETVDTHHRTRSDPEGTRMLEAMQAALADAGVAPEHLDYVNAHGTSTRDNDVTEAKALARLLGERAPRVPVSSCKSMLGHTLSAAGAIEAVLTLLMLERGMILPTINLETLDPDIALDVVPNTAREATVRTALSNSFGFGGQNVCLVLGASDHPAA